MVTLPWLGSQRVEQTDLQGNIIIYLQDMRYGRSTQYFSKLDGSAAFWQSQLDTVNAKKDVHISHVLLGATISISAQKEFGRRAHRCVHAAF